MRVLVYLLNCEGVETSWFGQVSRTEFFFFLGQQHLLPGSDLMEPGSHCSAACAGSSPYRRVKLYVSHFILARGLFLVFFLQDLRTQDIGKKSFHFGLGLALIHFQGICQLH